MSDRSSVCTCVRCRVMLFTAEYASLAIIIDLCDALSCTKTMHVTQRKTWHGQHPFHSQTASPNNMHAYTTWCNYTCVRDFSLSQSLLPFFLSLCFIFSHSLISFFVFFCLRLGFSIFLCPFLFVFLCLSLSLFSHFFLTIGRNPNIREPWISIIIYIYILFG